MTCWGSSTSTGRQLRLSRKSIPTFHSDSICLALYPDSTLKEAGILEANIMSSQYHKYRAPGLLISHYQHQLSISRVFDYLAVLSTLAPSDSTTSRFHSTDPRASTSYIKTSTSILHLSSNFPSCFPPQTTRATTPSSANPSHRSVKT